MLKQTISHYYPWTEPDGVATCGHRMTATDVHSPAPTCLTCTVRLAAIEAAEDETQPLDADEARAELDPILNAGLPARPMSPLGAELFALGQSLNHLALLRLVDARRDADFAAHRDGACDRGCGFCEELTALHRELVQLYTARRPDLDRLEEVEARLTDLGHADWIAVAARDAEQAVAR